MCLQLQWQYLCLLRQLWLVQGWYATSVGVLRWSLSELPPDAHYIHSYILHLLSCKNGEGTFYSRAQGHEHHSTQKKNSIFLRSVQEEMKPRSKKRWDWVDVLWKPVKLVFMHAPLIVLHQQKDELKANIAHSERLWHVLQWKCKKTSQTFFYHAHKHTIYTVISDTQQFQTMSHRHSHRQTEI